jgi:hypothetical protein
MMMVKPASASNSLSRCTSRRLEHEIGARDKRAVDPGVRPLWSTL